jgi:hypothetical protein
MITYEKYIGTGKFFDVFGAADAEFVHDSQPGVRYQAYNKINNLSDQIEMP